MSTHYILNIVKENQNEIGKTDSDLTLIGRNKLTVTGVKKIKSSEPTQIVLILSNCAMVVGGSNLYIVTASISTGEIEILGVVNTIRYTGVEQKQKFSLKNMFR